MPDLVVTIPKELADLVLERQRRHGFPTPDEAAAALISEGLAVSAEEDHSGGRTDDELRGLLDQAEASGPAKPWDAAAVRAEVLRRHARTTG